MSFIVDTNFIISLNEINRLDSLLSLDVTVIVPKLILDELHINTFNEMINTHTGKFLIRETTHNEKSKFIQDLAENNDEHSYNYYIEVADQINHIQIPDGWRVVSTLFRTPNVRELSNVLTNTYAEELGQVRKSEDTKLIEHPDAHLCSIAVKQKECYVLSMDASIWIALNCIDKQFKKQIITIFRYLSMLHRDEPIHFIETLTKIIEKRFTFSPDIIGNMASSICLEHLHSSVREVLARYISELILNATWDEKKNDLNKLFEIQKRINNAIERNTSQNNGTLSFNESGFINELNSIGQDLKIVDPTLN